MLRALILILLVVAGNTTGFAPGQIPGLIAAFIAAFVWSTYSVLSRRLKSVPTDAVAGFCAVTALLAALVHTLVETTVWMPPTLLQTSQLTSNRVWGCVTVRGSARASPWSRARHAASDHRVRS